MRRAPMNQADYGSLLRELTDPLAPAMAGPDGEPDELLAARLLPPLVGPTFLGGRDVFDKPVVLTDGTIEQRPLPPLNIEPGDLVCLGDMVPACLDMLGIDAAGRRVRRLLFAAPRDGRPTVWWRDESAAGTTIRRSDGPGVAVDAEADAFEAALSAVLEQQASEVREAAEFEVPPIHRCAARIGLLRGLNAFAGQRPKYGWGGYEHPSHDGFPPTIISLGHALIDCGLVTTAKQLLGHWLGTFVRDDGQFDYYGPTLAEQGMILDLAVRLARASRDGGWWSDVLAPLHHIAERLTALRDEHDGLVPGIAEADDHQSAEAQESKYYATNAWAVRGLATFAHLLGESGERYGVAAGKWSADVQWLLQADTITRPDHTPFVAARAGDHSLPQQMTAGRYESYANYRYYPELLSSRLLTNEQAQAVFTLRDQFGGSMGGCTRFQDWLDNWPAAELGLAALDYDRVEIAQRLLVGQLAFGHAAGHQTAYEQVGIVPEAHGHRAAKAGFCVPAQLVHCRLLRNLLVHEAADALWLNRGGFQRWIEDGYGVQGAATRWGRVGFHLDWDGTALTADVDLDDVQPAVPVRLRLRRPDGAPLTEVEVAGRKSEVTGDRITLDAASGVVRVVAR